MANPLANAPRAVYGQLYGAILQFQIGTEYVAPFGVHLKGQRVIQLTIVLLVIVCATGVLILPQVDLPDFTLNSDRSYVIALAHVSTSLSSTTVYVHGTVLNLRIASLPLVIDARSPRSPEPSLSLLLSGALRC
jgi:hypothetical protein